VVATEGERSLAVDRQLHAKLSPLKGEGCKIAAIPACATLVGGKIRLLNRTQGE
jgi:hypothetical protein